MARLSARSCQAINDRVPAKPLEPWGEQRQMTLCAAHVKRADNVKETVACRIRFWRVCFRCVDSFDSALIHSAKAMLMSFRSMIW
jgi:hypothetical protein